MGTLAQPFKFSQGCLHKVEIYERIRRTRRSDSVVQTASLDRALTVIIDSYDKRWGDSA